MVCQIALKYNVTLTLFDDQWHQVGGQLENMGEKPCALSGFRLTHVWNEILHNSINQWYCKLKFTSIHYHFEFLCHIHTLPSMILNQWFWSWIRDICESGVLLERYRLEICFSCVSFKGKMFHTQIYLHALTLDCTFMHSDAPKVNVYSIRICTSPHFGLEPAFKNRHATDRQVFSLGSTYKLLWEIYLGKLLIITN